MAEVKGVPDLLEPYTDDTLPTLPPVRDALERYRAALAAFNAAEPNDLGTTLDDRSPDLEATLDQLDVLDRIPAAFAAALRQLDTTFEPGAAAPGATLAAQGGDQLNALIRDHIAPDPFAPDADRTEQLLRHFNGTVDGLDEEVPAVAPLENANRYDGWRGAFSQFGRHGTNAWIAHAEANRIGNLATRYAPTTRVVVQAGISAEDAANALSRNTPIARMLDVRIPPALTRAGKVFGGVGITLNVLDAGQDLENEDWAGLGSNAASIAGSLILMGTGGPLIMTAGAVLVVGSLIYEANREEIDHMVGAARDRLAEVAEAVGGLFHL